MMTDLEKAREVLSRFQWFLDNGYSRFDASEKAIEEHSSGYEKSDLGFVLLVYCGSYIILFDSLRGDIFKKVNISED
jgi:hypothetical protein